SLTGDTIIFRVRATAPRGMNDSPLSVSVAFQKNRDLTITGIETYLETEDLDDMPEGFVEILVDKGMTLVKMEAFVTAANALVENMDEAETIMEMNTALKAFIAADFDFEPFVSAFVEVMLPVEIEATIALEEDPELIAKYQEIVTMLEDGPEAMILGIMETIDYLVSFQADIDNEFLTSFMDRAYPESMTDLNVEEILLVKEELITIMEENRPSANYVIVLIDMINAVAAIVDDSETLTQISGEDKLDVAAGILLAYDLSVDFIDSFDTAFFTKWTSLEEEAPSELMLYAEIEIMLMKQVAVFMNANETRIDEIKAAGETINDIMSELYEKTMEMIMVNAFVSSASLFDYDSLSDAQLDLLDDLSGDVIRNLLQVFIDTDGEIIRLLMITDEFYYYEGSYMSYYVNDALDEEYNDYTEYMYEYGLVQLKLVEQATLYLNALTKEFDTADINVFLDVIMASIPYADIKKETVGEEALASFEDATELQLTNLLPSLIPFLADLSAYMVDNQIMQDIIADFIQVDGYLKTTYGVDYLKDDEAAFDPYAAYLYTLRLSKNLNSFIGVEQETNLEISLAAIFDLISTFALYTDLIDEDSVSPILALETALQDLFDDLLVSAEIVKDYDFATLTVTQKEELMAIRNRIAEVFG
ncbi:MAG: hypothetical protein WC251_00320, partial [Candidatus Izemoplasmatales bacterium]